MARRVPTALRTVLAAVAAWLRRTPGAAVRLARALPPATVALLRRAAALARRVPPAAAAVAGAVVVLVRTAGRVLAHPVRVIREGFRLRYDRRGVLLHIAILLAFVALGLLLALPPTDVTHRCPAPGEGRGLCVVQKSYLPLFLIVFAAFCLGQFVARTVLVRVPEWRERHAERGERRVAEEDPREDPPYTRDPFLLAATWGQKKGPTERRSADPVGSLVRAGGAVKAGARRMRGAARLRRRRLPD